MTKGRRPRKKKKSEEWKKLLRAHKKGPKRIKLTKERYKKGVDPLTVREHTKRIQIVYVDGATTKKTCSVVLNSSFSNMFIREQKTYEMSSDKMSIAAKSLRRGFMELGHNDRILKRVKEIKTTGIAGRFLVADGEFKNPNVTLYIRTPCKKLTDTRDHVERLFSSARATGPVPVNVEYL